MPYGKKEELPDAVKALPEHGQEIWMAAFNSVFDQYKGDEEKCFAVAWAAVKNKFEKNEKDEWVAKAEHNEGLSGWIEIFRAGKQRDSSGEEREWSEADLDEIIKNYDPRHHEAPAVIGHPKEDHPAWAWTEALKREGKILFARLRDAIPEFAEMVRQGMFKKRSAAFYLQPKLSLKHIGFLGATAPAVKGLADIKFSGEGVTVEFQDREEEKKAQEARAKKYGIAAKEDGHVTKPGEWAAVPDDEFLDPVNYRYPCPNADQTRAAAAYWGKPDNQAQYSSEERGIINRRLQEREKKFKIGNYSEKKGGTQMGLRDILKGIFTKVIDEIPEDQLQAVPPKIFSEAEVKERERLAAEKAGKDFSEKEKGIKDREAAVAAKERETRKTEIVSFVEGLKKEGRVVPAMEKIGVGLTPFLVEIGNAATMMEFKEGEAVKKQTPLEFMKSFLGGLPTQIEFREVATRGADTGGTDGEKRDKLISDYAEKNKVGYKVAVLAVSKEHPDLFKER